MNEPHHPLSLWPLSWSACTECCCSCTVHASFKIMKTDSGVWIWCRSDDGSILVLMFGTGSLSDTQQNGTTPEYSKKYWVCPSTRGPGLHAQYGALKTVLVKWANCVITRLHTAPQEAFFSPHRLNLRSASVWLTMVEMFYVLRFDHFQEVVFWLVKWWNKCIQI